MLRYLLACFFVLVATAASAQYRTFPDLGLSTTSSDTFYTIPGDRFVTFELRDMPDFVKTVATDISVDLGQAYRVSLISDGTLDVKFNYFTPTSPGAFEEVAAVIELGTATSVTIFAWVLEE